jgi:hypothetical protein
MVRLGLPGTSREFTRAGSGGPVRAYPLDETYNPDESGLQPTIWFRDSAPAHKVFGLAMVTLT